jgi:hypothetical protein
MEIEEMGFVSKEAAISWANEQKELDSNFSYFLEGFCFEGDYMIGYYFN